MSILLSLSLLTFPRILHTNQMPSINQRIKTLSNIQNYANNVRPQMKEQISYMNLRVGFDAEPIEEVIKDMHAVSQGKAQVYRSPLEAAFMEQIIWLMPSYKGQSLKEMEDFINGMIKQIHTGHTVMLKYLVQKDSTDPPKVALIFKPIFDGMSKRERDEKGLKSEPVFGTHMIACHSQRASVLMLIDYILALPTFAAANKLNTLMIPVYNHSGGLSEVTKLKKAIGHQWYFQSNIYSTPVQGLLSLDIPNSKGLMACGFIMAIQCDNTNNIFLFTDANPSWNGFVINILFSKKFDKEAHFKAENLATYAFHDLGDSGLEFFSEEMRAVKLMGWDDGNNRPLVASNLEFDLTLQTPDPNSQMGMMFNFSKMEEVKSYESKMDSGRPAKEMEADSASLQSVAFSVMSNFLRFFNLDGMERCATDQCIQWQEAGHEGDPLDEDNVSISHKLEALNFFQKAVEDAVHDKMKEQETQIQTEHSQWQQQLQGQQEMMWQMQAQMQQMAKQQGFLVGDGDDISAPTPG